MNENMVPFDFDGNAVRAKEVDGSFWFVSKDICAILGLDNKETPRRLDSDEVGKTHLMDSMGRTQEFTIVSESGLYNLIFKSRKTQAQKFRKWVTSEVLPALRKNGSYSVRGVEGLSVDTSRSFFLNPTQKSLALQSAVQVARMSGGSEEDVERLYLKYSYMLSNRLHDKNDLEQNSDFRLFMDWTDANLISSERKDTIGQRMVIQAMPLYKLYCEWVSEKNKNPVSIILWGRWMKKEAGFRYEKRARGWYFVEWLGPGKLKTVEFCDINRAN